MEEMYKKTMEVGCTEKITFFGVILESSKSLFENYSKDSNLELSSELEVWQFDCLHPSKRLTSLSNEMEKTVSKRKMLLTENIVF